MGRSTETDSAEAQTLEMPATAVDRVDATNLPPLVSFTTRVELITPDSSDHSRLDAAMMQRGFSSNITSADGFLYRLPSAEYELRGRYTLEEAMSRGRAAAESTGKKFDILITQSAGRAAMLQRVQ